MMGEHFLKNEGNALSFVFLQAEFMHNGCNIMKCVVLFFGLREKNSGNP